MAFLVVMSVAAGCTVARSSSTSGTLPVERMPSTTTVAPSPAMATPAPAPSPSAPLARFRGTVSAIPADLAASMRGTTWHQGCPVPLSRLRLLTFTYWGFDGSVHQGPLVVNAAVAAGILGVFRLLFRARFPIHEVHLALRYVPGHEDPTDRRDYTAGFNCRPVVTARGPKPLWSQHAFGLAIDLNPIENPYVTSDGYVRNLNARPYRERSLARPGMIHPGDAVVEAFASIGWIWGGTWHGDRDYMHFSWNGR